MLINKLYIISHVTPSGLIPGKTTQRMSWEVVFFLFMGFRAAVLKCGLLTHSISLIWESVRNAISQVLPHIY